MLINTLNDFIRAVPNLNNEEVYAVIEFDMPGAVYDELIAQADPASPEPVRSAMHNLGFDWY